MQETENEKVDGTTLSSSLQSTRITFSKRKLQSSQTKITVSSVNQSLKKRPEINGIDTPIDNEDIQYRKDRLYECNIVYSSLYSRCCRGHNRMASHQQYRSYDTCK